MFTVFHRSHLKWAAFGGALALAALGPTAACVDRVEPCDKFDTFAEHYGGSSCPEVDSFATRCASGLTELDPAPRQSFDWCVDCYTLVAEGAALDCSQDPLEVSCATMLNTAIGSACTFDATTP